MTRQPKTDIILFPKQNANDMLHVWLVYKQENQKAPRKGFPVSPKKKKQTCLHPSASQKSRTSLRSSAAMAASSCNCRSSAVLSSRNLDGWPNAAKTSTKASLGSLRRWGFSTGDHFFSHISSRGDLGTMVSGLEGFLYISFLQFKNQHQSKSDMYIP